MPETLFFAHANGFPSATYGKLFGALTPEFAVRHLPQHGHDPRFPVEDNWKALVDELLHHLRAVGAPVWGVGHSLGGVLHLHAALRHPELYRGVIMLDSPLLSSSDQWLIRAAKRFGLIDRITPAGRTLGRRDRFEDQSSARDYFLSKPLFKDFDPECLDAYLEHGLKPDGDGLRLAFEPDTEIRIYRSVPHVSPGRPSRLALPVAVVGGERSRVVLRHHARNARRLPRGEFHLVPGGHMFPLEQPLQTAELVRGVLRRWQAEALVP
ncbi:alpha/beta hydrolase [Pseudomonas sp. RIT-PI-S]|uniref:alpha/beta fold hydrolase n=1 Tax=Pseudomonas sp. RIT-PI-S TaxID=3035295 RepID=UPI0021D83228|nr:alpha/beta hydrolase [Pseudomonas sp. RIT-PI-S]